MQVSFAFVQASWTLFLMQFFVSFVLVFLNYGFTYKKEHTSNILDKVEGGLAYLSSVLFLLPCLLQFNCLSGYVQTLLSQTLMINPERLFIISLLFLFFLLVLALLFSVHFTLQDSFTDCLMTVLCSSWVWVFLVLTADFLVFLLCLEIGALLLLQGLACLYGVNSTTGGVAYTKQTTLAHNWGLLLLFWTTTFSTIYILWALNFTMFHQQFVSLSLMANVEYRQFACAVTSLWQNTGGAYFAYVSLLTGILFKMYLVPVQFIIFMLYRKLSMPAMVLYLSLYYVPFVSLALVTLFIFLLSFSSPFLYLVVGLFGFILTCAIVLQSQINDFSDVFTLSTLASLTLITLGLSNF